MWARVIYNVVNSPKKDLKFLTISRLQDYPWRGCRTKHQEKIRGYLLTRLINYLKSYDKVLEKRFPSAVKVYRVFSVGVKEFRVDLALFFQVYKKAISSGQNNLTHHELMVYHRMPKDIVRVAPVLILTPLPLGSAIFPVAYMFPRTFLSYHFWSLQQRSEFAMLDHRKKLNHYRPVFRCLQEQLRNLKTHPVHKSWSRVLGMLGSGVHPTPCEILECQCLFALPMPYHIKALTSSHVSHLLRVHGMHRGWFRRSRLSERARLIQRMDEALKRQGGPSGLTAEELRWACYFRGLNPTNVSFTDTVKWLESWLEVSAEVNEKNLSLLLHTPLLLGYNQPSNWTLLHS